MAKNLKPITKPTATAAGYKVQAPGAPLKVCVIGKRVLIDSPITGPSLSASGKSHVIATSSGNVVTEATWEDQPLVVGFNVYFKA